MTAFSTHTLTTLFLCCSVLMATAQVKSTEENTSYGYSSNEQDRNHTYHYDTDCSYNYSSYNDHYNKASYAKLGVYFEKDETKVLIKKVVNNSAAAIAGLQAGDRLIALDQVKVWGTNQLVSMIRHYKGGETVRITYQRVDQIQELTAVLDKEINKRYNDQASYQSPCDAVKAIKNRPFLGVCLDRSRKEDKDGARITSIISNTGASASELQAEDHIISLDGIGIRNSSDVHYYIRDQKKSGESMNIEVLRDNQRVVLTAVVGSWGDRQDRQERLSNKEAACERFSNPATACASLQQLESSPFLGVVMDNVRQEDGGGALITSVIEGTQAAQTDLRGGDKIIAFNGVEITSHPDASNAISNAQPNDPVRLVVLRGDKVMVIKAIMGSYASRPSVRSKVAALEAICVLKTDETPATAPKEATDSKLGTTETPLLRLFPNPSSSYVHVLYAGQQGALVVSITTLDGKSVYDKKVPTFVGTYNDQIDVSNLPAGVYILYITQGAVRLSKQLIVE